MCADQRKLKTFEMVITLWEKNVETHAKEKVSWNKFVYFIGTLLIYWNLLMFCIDGYFGFQELLVEYI